MKISFKYLALISVLSFSAGTGAEELGRLFTTAKERLMLEKLRNAKPVTDTKISEVKPVDEFFEEQSEGEEVVEEVEEQITLEVPVSLKGVVYRESGSNTAWINESNTYDGDLTTKNINVRNRNIKKDKVKVEIPGDVTEVTLKVGETYQPITEPSTDMTNN